MRKLGYLMLSMKLSAKKWKGIRMFSLSVKMLGNMAGFGELSWSLHEIGEMRAKDTPISESGIIGLATGAAMAGLRPIADIMYMDFVTTCMDPIVNQAAKADMMSGFQFKIPMVIRTQFGIGTGKPARPQSLRHGSCILRAQSRRAF